MLLNILWFIAHPWLALLGILSMSLQDWSYVAQIITTFSIVIAMLTYYQQKEETRNASISNQVSLFRKEIIPLSEVVDANVKKIIAATKQQLVAIEFIDDFSVSWLLNHRTAQTLNQQDFWSSAAKVGIENYSLSINRLLNAMEELSIDIIARKVSGSKQLESIQTAFVTYVEANAWPMVLGAPYNRLLYPGIRALYKEWVGLVPRISPDEVKRRVAEDIEGAADKLQEARRSSK